MNPAILRTLLSGALRGPVRIAYPVGSRIFSGITEGVPEWFLHSGDHTRKPTLADQPGTQAYLGSHNPHFPTPVELIFPSCEQ